MFDSFWDMAYPCAIVISKGESKSGPCQVCKDHHGTYLINSEAELEKLELPPYHPNCVCEVEVREAAEDGLSSYGTRLDMMEVLQSAKKIFNDVCHAYKKKGGGMPSSIGGPPDLSAPRIRIWPAVKGPRFF